MEKNYLEGAHTILEKYKLKGTTFCHGLNVKNSYCETWNFTHVVFRYIGLYIIHCEEWTFDFLKSNWISKNWPSCGGLPAQSKPVQTSEKEKKILSTAFSVVVEYVHICLDWDSIMLCFTANRLFIPNGLFLWPLLSFLAKKDTSLDFGVFNLGLEINWYFIPSVPFFLCLLKEPQFRLWIL